MVSEVTYFSYNTPLGIVTIEASSTALTRLALGKHVLKGKHKPGTLTNKAANQLQEYFAGKREHFDLPLGPEGTDFQKKIWGASQQIPYGNTASFEQIARQTGDEKAARAAGIALNKNPLPIFIPSHRIVSASGKPSGTESQKKLAHFLLNLETQRP